MRAAHSVVATRPRAKHHASLPRIASNLQLWISTLVSQAAGENAAHRAGSFLVFAGVVAVIIASMFLLDAAASEWARQLPPWVT